MSIGEDIMKTRKSGMFLLILSVLIWTHAAAIESNLLPCTSSNPYRALDSKCLSIEEICSKNRETKPPDISQSELLGLMTQLNKSRNIEIILAQLNKSHNVLQGKLVNIEIILVQSNKSHNVLQGKLVNNEIILAQLNKSHNVLQGKLVNIEIILAQLTKSHNVLQGKLVNNEKMVSGSGYLIAIIVMVIITWIILLLEVRFKIITKFCEGKDIRKSRKYILIDAQSNEQQTEMKNLKTSSSAVSQSQNETKSMLDKHFPKIQTEIQKVIAQFQKMQTDIQELKTASSAVSQCQMETKSTLDAQFQKVQTEIQELKTASFKYQEQSKQMINDKLKSSKDNPNVIHDSPIPGRRSELKTAIAEAKEMGGRNNKDVNNEDGNNGDGNNEDGNNGDGNNEAMDKDNKLFR